MGKVYLNMENSACSAKQSGESSRRGFLFSAAGMAIAAALSSVRGDAQESFGSSPTGGARGQAVDLSDLHFPSKDAQKTWKERSFNIDRWWGDFAHDLPDQMDMWSDNPWALGPFTKYAGNPILAPTRGAWDQGHFGGGVHNGSIIVKDGHFYYVYRGERPIDVPQKSDTDYICDTGVAVSDDGIHFTKDTRHSPFFREGEDRRYSYEEVNISRQANTYYMFVNRWLWERMRVPAISGTFLATSRDLLHWTKVGLVFPHTQRIHQNAVVLQNPENVAVKVNDKYVMYMNGGLIAYSTDMVHWESHESPHRWPGGECCFALADHNPERPDDIILFTGGNHTGHFYAIGEVLFSKADPEKPLDWLPRSPLFAEPKYPFEHGFTATAPHEIISDWNDTIFFTGLTRHQGKWWLYYGGSEYYTCLATCPAKDHA